MFLTIVPIVKKLNEQIIYVIQTVLEYFSRSLVICLQYIVANNMTFPTQEKIEC